MKLAEQPTRRDLRFISLRLWCEKQVMAPHRAFPHEQGNSYSDTNRRAWIQRLRGVTWRGQKPRNVTS